MIQGEHQGPPAGLLTAIQDSFIRINLGAEQLDACNLGFMVKCNKLLGKLPLLPLAVGVVKRNEKKEGYVQ